MKRTYAISTKTVLQTIVVVALVLAVIYLQRIVFMVCAAFIIAAAVEIGTQWLKKRGVPRLLAVITWFLAFIAVMGGGGVIFVPPLVTELGSLIQAFPQTLDEVVNTLPPTIEQWGEAILSEVSIQSMLSQTGESVFSTTRSILGGLVSVILTLVLAFFIALSPHEFDTMVARFAPRENQRWIKFYMGQARERVGEWLVGHVAIALLLGLLVFAILEILQVPYALALAFLAGLLQLIPFLGPILAAIPAFLFAWVQSPYLAILVVIGYIILYQIETIFLTPILLRQTAGLNPVLIIIALLVGAKLAGVMGFLLAIPVVGALAVFRDELAQMGQEESPRTVQTNGN